MATQWNDRTPRRGTGGSSVPGATGGRPAGWAETVTGLRTGCGWASSRAAVPIAARPPTSTPRGGPLPPQEAGRLSHTPTQNCHGSSAPRSPTPFPDRPPSQPPRVLWPWPVWSTPAPGPLPPPQHTPSAQAARDPGLAPHTPTTFQGSGLLPRDGVPCWDRGHVMEATTDPLAASPPEGLGTPPVNE